MKLKKLPDGTEFKWNPKGNITYHATNGVNDTNIYLAKQRVEKKKEEKLQKLQDKPKLQKAVSKVVSTKAFQNIALKVAERKIKKSLGK